MESFSDRRKTWRNLWFRLAPNDAFAKYFTGKSYINKLTSDEAFMPMSNVTFESGCRNNWHVHNSKFPIGQVLICVDGESWYQEFGKEAIKLSLGMVVEIPANAKHWHGAAKDYWFSHIAFSIPDETATTEWCKEVSDGEHNTLS